MRIIYGKEERLKRKAASMLALFLKRNQKQSILFLSSGGSALEPLAYVRGKFDKGITFSVLDERFSRNPSTSSRINNFLKLKNTPLFKRALEDNARFIDTLPQRGETLLRFARRFEKALQEWRKKNPRGLIVVTLGIGVDGHTAGIMPYPENPKLFRKRFIETKKWIVGYNAKKKNPYPLRITATIPFLQVIDFAVVYATGKEKQNALKRALAKNGSLAETPARVIQELKRVILFTDQKI